MNGHPRDQAKVSVHCRWPLIRGNLTLKCVGRGIDNVAVQGRWPLTTGVAQGRYYCITDNITDNLPIASICHNYVAQMCRRFSDTGQMLRLTSILTSVWSCLNIYYGPLLFTCNCNYFLLHNFMGNPFMLKYLFRYLLKMLTLLICCSCRGLLKTK